MEDLMTSEESNREYLNIRELPRMAPCPHCHKPLDYAEAQSNGGVHAEKCLEEVYPARSFDGELDALEPTCAHEWGGGTEEYPPVYCTLCGEDGDA